MTEKEQGIQAIVTDNDGCVVSIAPGIATQLGLDATAVLGKRLSEILIERIARRDSEILEVETQLTQTVSELEAIINALPGMVSVVDRDFKVLIANQAVIERFGQSRKDEVIGKTCHSVRKGLSSPCPQCGVRQAFETGEAVTRVSTPEEEAMMGICTKAYAVPLKDDTGKVWGGVEVIMDVTDLRQAEEALRENENRLRTIIEQAADAVYVSDMSGRIVQVNRKACDDTGFSRQELLRKTVMDIDSAYRSLADCRAKWDAIPMEGILRFEGRHRRRDGSEFPVEINTSAILINEAKHILGFARDITDRKQAEERLRHFKNAVECSTNAVGMSTVDGRHYYQNQAFTEMFGDIGDDPPASIYVDEAVGREVFRAITAGGEWSGEVAMYGRHRKVLTILLNANAIKDDDGNVIGAVGVHSDITAAKQAEAERIHLEQQIHKNQKLESLGVLAGGIAHDFNNLLGGIFGYIEIAKRESQPSTVREYLDKSLSTIDRARALTRQLLTFAKGGAPNRTVHPLFPLVRETVEFALCGATVSPSFSVADDLYACSIDPHQIGQVIDNIIINAKQAMPNGGTVVVSAENVSPQEREVLSLPKNDYVRLSIIDEGIGMPREVVSKIFDPFYTTKQAGSGLGLSTAYSIVKRHEGAIVVASEPGKGSRFDIYLPAVIGDTGTQSDVPIAAHTLKGRVLIMDDEQSIRESTVEMCRTIGFEASAVKDGAAAIERFSEAASDGRPFSAVILDLTVPGGMGGKDALRALRELDPSVPIYVCSGYTDDPSVAEPVAYGFTASIRKPFRIAELEALLAGR